MNDSTTVLARIRPICRTFRGDPSQIPLVREFVKRHLVDERTCPESALHDILLCASEIATNAILHTSSGGGHFTVGLRVRDGAARIEVIDSGSPSGSNGTGHVDGSSGDQFDKTPDRFGDGSIDHFGDGFGDGFEDRSGNGCGHNLAGHNLADLGVNASAGVERFVSSRSANGASGTASVARRGWLSGGHPSSWVGLLPGGDSAGALPQGGLGLRLVSAHADRMGYDKTAHGGIAWFERTWDIGL